MELGEPLAVTLLFVKILDDLTIDYMVGGSLASSLHGIPRSTHDVDIIVDLDSTKVDAMIHELNDEFYVSKSMIYQAIQQKRLFNIIHLKTMFKIDVFILKDDEAAQDEIKRRQLYAVDEFQREKLYIVSPEDVIVEKLHWFQLGNRISDRQWQDVLGVLKVCKDSLDRRYLKKAALRMNVLPLLKQAIRESTISCV